MLALLLLLTTCYAAPVDAPVSEPFTAPVCTYCPGHRGVSYTTAPGQAVRAVSSGVVAFSGVVAGTRYVTVDDADGLVASYGMLAAATVQSGDVVAAGQVIALTTATLLLTIRRDGVYLDPAPLIGHATRHARLVPTDGSPARAAAPGAPTCAAAAGFASPNSLWESESESDRRSR